MTPTRQPCEDARYGSPECGHPRCDESLPQAILTSPLFPATLPGKAGAPSRTVPRALALRMILGCGHRTLAEPQR